MHIRNEEPRDHGAVEALTRRAFYNLYVPGCVEHYLVHIMREHQDFIPELDFVLEENGRIIGNIMYTRAKLVDEAGREKEILTFGPVCVEPELQRRGYGKQLGEVGHRHPERLQRKQGIRDFIVITGGYVDYAAAILRNGIRTGKRRERQPDSHGIIGCHKRT